MAECVIWLTEGYIDEHQQNVGPTGALLEGLECTQVGSEEDEGLGGQPGRRVGPVPNHVQLVDQLL